MSIDGLQPEHDVRRAPATYERILKHIEGQHITIHCTLTRQQARPGYATTFTEFWAPNPNVKRIWFSMYTPQQGEQSAEMLTQEDRRLLVDEIGVLHARHPKLMDMIPAVTRGYLKPPASPERLHLCADVQVRVGRPRDANHALSVRRRSRLHPVRLHGVRRLRSARSVPPRRRHSTEDDLRGFPEDRRVVRLARRTATARRNDSGLRSARPCQVGRIRSSTNIEPAGAVSQGAGTYPFDPRKSYAPDRLQRDAARRFQLDAGC